MIPFLSAFSTFENAERIKPYKLHEKNHLLKSLAAISYPVEVISHFFSAF